MKKQLAIFFCCLMVVSMACQLTNIAADTQAPDTSITKISPSGTSAPDSTAAKPATNTLLAPTASPEPTKRPTSPPVVLTDEEFEADIQSDCSTDVLIKGYADGTFSVGGGSMSLLNGKIALWCYGAKHTWIGKISYAGYTFESDENDPMKFQVVKDEGYRFIGGIGLLTYPDGKKVELYQPTGASMIPTKSTKKPTSAAPERKKCEADDGKKEIIQFTSPYAESEITLDGEFSADYEWGDAFCMDMQFFKMGDMHQGQRQFARWYVQHDIEFIYFLVMVQADDHLNGVGIQYFWPEHTGTWANSDSIFVDLNADVQDLANWDEVDWYEDSELDPAGSVDGEAYVTELDDYYMIEIKRPLASGDLYDWIFRPGDEIGAAPSDSFVFAIFTDEGVFTRSLKMKLDYP